MWIISNNKSELEFINNILLQKRKENESNCKSSCYSTIISNKNNTKYTMFVYNLDLKYLNLNNLETSVEILDEFKNDEIDEMF
jgi:hypothetical protein